MEPIRWGPLGSWAVVAASATLAVEGWRTLASAPGGPWHAMVGQGTVLVGPAVLVLVAIAVVVERLWPAERRPIGARGHRQDVSYLALYVVVAVPAVTLIGTGAASFVLRLDGGVTLHPLAVLPGWALLVSVLVVMVMDFANWASHLLNHRLDSFWRYHALHHTQEELSILTAFRAHPLVHTSFQLAAVPLIVLGTGGAVPASLLVAYVVLSTLPHANVNWRLGPLRYVLVTPAYHRLHHDRADGRDVNLGTVLVVWDVLARMAVFPETRSAPVETGLAGRPLPVEQDPAGAGWAVTMGRQLWSPIQGRWWSAAPIERSGVNAGSPVLAGASRG